MTALAAAIKAQVDQHVAQARALAAAAQSLQIRNATEAKLATEFLARAAKARKANETARVAAVKPLNDQVKAINAAFKGDAEQLLADADRLVRERLTAYEVEQDRLRREEEARLEAERRAEQERLDAEQRRLAEEAERARREAEDAERRRLTEIAVAQDALAQKVAGWSDEDLAEVESHPGADADLRDAARVEMDARTARREQEQRAAAAQAAADAAQVAQLQALTAPVAAVAPAGPTRSASGSASLRRRWIGEVVDASRVPREYLAVDQRLINQAIKDGVREIPGVRIYQDFNVAVRTA